MAAADRAVVTAMTDTTPLLGAIIAALFATGVLLMVTGWHGHRLHFATMSRANRIAAVDGRRLAIAMGVAVLVGLISRWPIAAVGAGAATWMAPTLFGGSSAGSRELERLEALATWIESLRDTIAGTMSLEQAIPATLDAAVPSLRAPLSRLVGLLRGRVPLSEALRDFADDLDDPGADLVVAALIMNARMRGPGLEATLSELAVHAREELEQRQVVEAGRKSLHRSAKVIVLVVLAFSTGLVLFARDYVTPYASIQGQLVLTIVVVIFALGFARLRKLAEFHRPPRFLATQGLGMER